MKTDSISMKHLYNDPELAQLSRDIANALNRRSSLEAEFDSVKQDFKAQITAQEALVASLSARVSSGFEMQNVKCLLFDERPAGYAEICDRVAEIIPSAGRESVTTMLSQLRAKNEIGKGDDLKWRMTGTQGRVA